MGRIGCLAIIVLLVVGGIGAALSGHGSNGSGGGSRSSNSIDHSPDGDAAYVAKKACENSVKNQLVSPATAHFHNEDASWSGTDLSPRFTVSGEVDSENRFGALLTTIWTCRATTSDNGDSWDGRARLFGS